MILPLESVWIQTDSEVSGCRNKYFRDGNDRGTWAGITMISSRYNAHLLTKPCKTKSPGHFFSVHDRRRFHAEGLLKCH